MKENPLFEVYPNPLTSTDIVDMYVKIKTSRFDYFRHKQADIRADLYQGIVDSLAHGESRGSKVGKRIILPGYFIGGPRDM